MVIVADKKVPRDPPEAIASWEGGVLIVASLFVVGRI